MSAIQRWTDVFHPNSRQEVPVDYTAKRENVASRTVVPFRILLGLHWRYILLTFQLANMQLLPWERHPVGTALLQRIQFCFAQTQHFYMAELLRVDSAADSIVETPAPWNPVTTISG